MVHFIQNPMFPVPICRIDGEIVVSDDWKEITCDKCREAYKEMKQELEDANRKELLE